jgi:hypothetical protein
MSSCTKICRECLQPNGSPQPKAYCKPCRKIVYRRYARKLYSEQRDKKAKYQRDLREKDPDAYRKSHYIWSLKRKYGMEFSEYERLMTKQESKCAICRDEVKLVVDHCHETGNIRGLLCGGCNRGIGLLRDRLDIVISAVEYLKGFEEHAKL